LNCLFFNTRYNLHSVTSNAVAGAISTEVSNRNTAITNAINTEVANRNTAISTAVNGLIKTYDSFIGFTTEFNVSSGLYWTITVPNYITIDNVVSVSFLTPDIDSCKGLSFTYVGIYSNVLYFIIHNNNYTYDYKRLTVRIKYI
jgi:hypothetical protein